MPSLGSFGAAVREFDPVAERDTFDFFGETFTVEGVIPSMLMLQLGAALVGKIPEMEGNAAVWESLRCALSKPDREVDGKTVRGDGSQFERFYKIAVRRKCDFDELFGLTLSIVGAQAGKADAPPETSPDGLQPASTSSSSSASDSPDSPVLRPVDEVLGGSTP
jgi:hypothetical protein